LLETGGSAENAFMLESVTAGEVRGRLLPFIADEARF